MSETKKVKLISRVNYPVVIKYKGEDMVVAPNETIKKVDKAKLGSVPNTIAVVNM
jgi:hypothetical protein